MKKILIIILTFLICHSPSMASNCTSEDIETAEFWNNYYEPQEAYDFGIKIQNIVQEKDLKSLFEFVDGELKSGPRKSFIKNKNFSEIFSQEWTNSLLSSSPSCSPMGYRGFMLDSGSIWYNKEDNGWKIFAINGAKSEEDKSLIIGWSHNGKVINPTCFARVWMSGDNFEEFADQFKISNYERFSKKPGEFFGKEIDDFNPIKAMWDEYIKIINPIDDCSFKDSKINDDEKFITIKGEGEFGTIEYGYSIIENINKNKCLELSPNLGYKCLSSYLVKAGDYSGGSMGWDMSYGIYGLFDLDKLGPSIIPLIFFENKNEALNYLSN